MSDHDHDDLVARFGLCPRCVRDDARRASQSSSELVCDLCSEPVDLSDRRTHQLMVGWARTRQQGGTHALALRRELHRYAHADCIDLAKLGRLDQPALPDLS